MCIHMSTKTFQFLLSGMKTFLRLGNTEIEKARQVIKPEDKSYDFLIAMTLIITSIQEDVEKIETNYLEEKKAAIEAIEPLTPQDLENMHQAFLEKTGWTNEEFEHFASAVFGEVKQ